MSSVRFLHLEPTALRSASPISPFHGAEREPLKQDGSGLPAVLARLEAKDPRLLAEVARDLRTVVPDVQAVAVRRDDVQQRLEAAVTFDHGGPFPASLLSDGTLRVLALTALKHDLDHRGVLCFEEPENGIHPVRMRGLLAILTGLSTDPSAESTGGQELRQLIVNTHSPALISVADADALLFAQTSRRLLPRGQGSVLNSRFLPVRDELPLRQRGEPPSFVTRSEVRDLLASVEQQHWQIGHEAAE